MEKTEFRLHFFHIFSEFTQPIGFFSYIAGGFGTNIDSQILSIYKATNIPGSAMCVSNLIKMVENSQKKKYSHERIKQIFGLNRQILLNDVI